MKQKRNSQKAFKFLALCFMLSCFFGCTNHEHDGIETITINPKETNNNVNIEIKSIVHLATSDTTLIGHVNTVKYFKNRYYIFDKDISKALFVFDSSGKFINKTRLGKGPGEVIMPYCFYINESNNTIILWDQMMFNLNIYDLDLSFKKSINCPQVSIKSFGQLDNNSFLVFSQFFPVVNSKIAENVGYI